MWIKVRARVEVIDEDLLNLDIESNKKEYYTTDVAIRTEDIKRFNVLTAKKTVLYFYEDKPLIILEAAADLFTRIEKLDYEQPLLKELREGEDE